MAWSPVDVSAKSALLSAHINQLQENIEHVSPSPDPSVKLRFAGGIKQLTWDGVSNGADVNVVFASDSDWGDPEFTAAPLIQLTIFWANGDTGVPIAVGTYIYPYYSYVGLSASGFTINVNVGHLYPSNGQTLSVSWLAIGP